MARSTTWRNPNPMSCCRVRSNPRSSASPSAVESDAGSPATAAPGHTHASGAPRTTCSPRAGATRTLTPWASAIAVRAAWSTCCR